MSKLKVDHQKCIRCGTCAAVYPNFFEINDRVKVKDVEIGEEMADNVVSVCPVGAISIIKE